MNGPYCFYFEKYFKAKTPITLLWFHKQNERKKIKVCNLCNLKSRDIYNKLLYITLNNRNRAQATTNYFHDRNQQYGSNLPKTRLIIKFVSRHRHKPMCQKIKK